MNKEVRIESYRKMYAHLKEKKELYDFQYSSEQKELEFSFRSGDFHFEYCLYTNADRLKIRAWKEVDLEDDEAAVIANTITSKYPGMIGTAYDGKMILESNVFFVGVSDDEAAKKIYKETNSFVSVVLDYISRSEDKSSAKPDDCTEVEKTLAVPDMQDLAENENDTEDEGTFGEVQVEKGTEAETEVSEMKQFDKTNEDRQEELQAAGDEEKEASDNNPEDSNIDLESEDKPDVSTSVVTDSLIADEKENSKPNAPEITEKENDTFTRNNPSHKAAESMKPDEDTSCDIPESVPSNIKKILESINQTFSMRKEQLDYRDRVTMKKKEQLDILTMEIDTARSNIEEQRKKLTESDEKLRRKWENYNAAKRNLKAKEEDLAKKEEEISQLEAEIQQKKEELEELLKSNQLQKEELHVLKNYIAERSAEHEKTVAAFESEKSDFKEKNASMIEKIQELEAKEEELRLMEKQLNMREETLNAQYDDMKAAEKLLEERSSDETSSGTSDLLAKLQKENTELRKQIECKFHDSQPGKEKKAEIDESSTEKAGSPDADISDKSIMEEMKQENESVKKDYSELQETHKKETEKWKMMLDDKSQQIDRLRSEAEQAAAKVQEAHEQVRQLENQVALLTSENTEIKSKLKEKDIVIDQIKKQNVSISMKRDQVIDELKEAGYEMEEMQCEESLLFRGAKDKVTFYVDKAARVLYAEIPARPKYNRLLMEWNEENIRFAYSMSKRKATCRCVYDNIVDDLGEILKKFSAIK